MEILAFLVLALYGASIVKAAQPSTPPSSPSTGVSPDLLDPRGTVIVSSAEMGELFSAADREDSDE